MLDVLTLFIKKQRTLTLTVLFSVLFFVIYNLHLVYSEAFTAGIISIKPAGMSEMDFMWILVAIGLLLALAIYAIIQRKK